MAAAAQGDWRTSAYFAKEFARHLKLGSGMTPEHQVRAQQQYLLLHQLTYDGPDDEPSGVAQPGVHIFQYTRRDLPVAPAAEGWFPHIEVTGEDSIEAAVRLLRHPERVAVLDMAASRLPGGGWYTGRKTQEEELMRRTGLALWLFSGKDMRSAAGFFGKHVTTNLYDMHIKGRLIPNMAHPVYYEPGGLVPGEKVLIAEDVPILYPDVIDYAHYDPGPIVPFERRRRIGVIVAAATPYGHVKEFTQARADPRSTVEQIIRNNVLLILHAARQRRYKRLVLGALGTGAFNNDYNVVARIFIQTIEEYGRGFQRIVFAILSPPGRAAGNRDAFAREVAAYTARNEANMYEV